MKYELFVLLAVCSVCYGKALDLQKENLSKNETTVNDKLVIIPSGAAVEDRSKGNATSTPVTANSNSAATDSTTSGIVTQKSTSVGPTNITTTSIAPTTAPSTAITVPNATNASTVTTSTIAPTSTKPSPPKPSPPKPTVKPATSTETTLGSSPLPATTALPSDNNRKFDGPSFVGGIVLACGLTAIGLVAFKFYKARTELNYHTL